MLSAMNAHLGALNEGKSAKPRPCRLRSTAPGTAPYTSEAKHPRKPLMPPPRTSERVAMDANTKYLAAHERATRRLRQVEEILVADAERHAKDPRGSGFTGDMEHIAEQLGNIVEAFKPEEKAR